VVNPEVIRRRLSQLDEYVSIVRRLGAYSLQEFLDDPEHYGSAERFLQLAIETTIDVGNHLIAESGWGPVDRYAEIPAILAQRGCVTPELRDKWIRMIGFRNILVHDYLDVDRTQVFRILHDGLADLEALRVALAAFL